MSPSNLPLCTLTPMQHKSPNESPNDTLMDDLKIDDDGVCVCDSLFHQKYHARMEM